MHQQCFEATPPLRHHLPELRPRDIQRVPSESSGCKMPQPLLIDEVHSTKATWIPIVQGWYRTTQRKGQMSVFPIGRVQKCKEQKSRHSQLKDQEPGLGCFLGMQDDALSEARRRDQTCAAIPIQAREAIPDDILTPN